MKVWAIIIGLAVLAFLVMGISVARADDTLGLMLSDEAGIVSTHAQASNTEQCAAFLDLFRERRNAGVKLVITLHDPEFTGVVLASVCLHDDGTMTGPDGPMLDLGL